MGVTVVGPTIAGLMLSLLRAVGGGNEFVTLAGPTGFADANIADIGTVEGGFLVVVGVGELDTAV